MSDLSYMKKLIDGVEVEWKTLADVTLPISNIKWRDVDHTHRYIDLSSVSIETKKITETSEIDARNAPSRAQKLIQEGDTVFATTRPTQMRYCLIDGIYSGEVASTGYCVLRPQINNILPKWILYCIASKRFKSHVENNESGAAYPAISDAKVKAFEIPVPPLNIQAEIVQILDAFTELTTELTTELVARKQQYAYYRDQLFMFNKNQAEWIDLGEVGAVRMCKRVLKNQTSDVGDIPFYKIGTFGKKPNAYITQELFNEYKTKYSYPKISEVLISASGTIGRTVIFDGRDAYFQDSNIVWVENNESKVLNKYLFYFYQVVNWNVSEGGTIKRLYNDNLRKIKIPIPSLAEQKGIVAILDKFDTLTTSLTEGLPCEITLRQQQYEYYRELLLNFPKPEVVDHD